MNKITQKIITEKVRQQSSEKKRRKKETLNQRRKDKNNESLDKNYELVREEDDETKVEKI